MDKIVNTTNPAVQPNVYEATPRRPILHLESSLVRNGLRSGLISLPHASDTLVAQQFKSVDLAIQSLYSQKQFLMNIQFCLQHDMVVKSTPLIQSICLHGMPTWTRSTLFLVTVALSKLRHKELTTLPASEKYLCHYCLNGVLL